MDAVTIEAGGKVHHLRLTMRAMMAVEERLGEGFFAVVQRLDNPETMRVGDLTVILAAMLENGRGAPEAVACDLFDAAGFQAVMAAFGEAVAAGMPAEAAAGEKKKMAPTG
jgi:hypothetical protein